MTQRTFDEIRAIYIKRFPHLTHITGKKPFAKAALMLAAPEGIKATDLLILAWTANS